MLHVQDKDPLWVQLRHRFIADVQRDIADQTTSFAKKNAAAKGGAAKGEMELKDLKRLAQALPEYRWASKLPI